ncbi:MAG: NBR1-Ig-like domain-containing protein [Chloroflexota bacterium]
MDTDRVKRVSSVSIFLLLASVLVAGLSACNGQGDALPTAFLAPTRVAYGVPEATVPLATQVQYLPTVFTCSDALSFVEDLTIPDGSQAAPGETLDKQWLVGNSGTCDWDSRYRLRLNGGDALGAPIEQALYPARAGSQAVIRIAFVAPATPGRYRSAWQAYDSRGFPFGDPIFIEIVVIP